MADTVTMRILQHAFGGTHGEYRVTDRGDGHTVADLDAKRFGELTVADRTFVTVA